MSKAHTVFVRRLALLTLLAPALLVHATSFPEEAFRSSWDLGCEDWKMDPKPNQRVSFGRGVPVTRTTKAHGVFRVQSKMLLPLELGESAAQVAAQAVELLSNPRVYPLWVLPRINNRKNSGRYFVEVSGMDVQTPGPGHAVFTSNYEMDLGLMVHRGQSSVELKILPGIQNMRCKAPQRDLFFWAQSPVFLYRMTPHPQILEWLVAEVVVGVPSSQGVELRLRLVAKPRPLVYNLMPEALVVSQLDERGAQLFVNFSELRRLERLKKMRAGADPAKP